MAKARINGQNVEVTKENITKGAVKDVAYKISGDGADKLYTALLNVDAKPVELPNGGFTILGSQMTDIPFLKILSRQFEAAAAGAAKAS